MLVRPQALTSVVERSKATTMMGLEKELKEAAHSLERRACMQETVHAPSQRDGLHSGPRG